MSGSSLGNGYLLAVLNGTQEMKMSPAPLSKLWRHKKWSRVLL